ncbi:hypothetical protein OAL13_00090 [bacterium]|nr:hypothetical protein [bacterium]
MPPLSTHLQHSPVASAPLGVEEIILDGRVFRVTKLKACSEKDAEREAAAWISKQDVQSRIKALTPEQRKEYKLGLKLSKMPQAMAERKAASIVRARKLEAFRKERNIKYVRGTLRHVYKDKLEPTLKEVIEELNRLAAFVAVINNGYDAN